MSIPQSFFVSEDLQVRDVKLSDGSTHPIHFKELPALVWNKFFEELNSTDEKVRVSAVIKLLSLSVCNEDGSQGFTLEQAGNLKADAMNSMLDAVRDVNGATPKAQEKLGND